ncbi:putative SUI1 domain, PUA domain, PUA-like superfamily, SUI1 domain superfamily, Pre-PUA protein [Helianthus annuus]|nr:putative SUI1 domain, PUA domain, PUA-like superfamily, SUI1 domain superfamily, Pre-PUA protein [Helianthus annuus]KAJ0617925.1 putative SUI1 domain, PUA domain, PUA-like superfamily, SUI1 domain superfamily, Pre-PUA protein [Helianthus annuus]
MFKKSVEAKSQQRLSGADRKKLKRTIKDRFPNASDSDLDILIPPKVEITVSKQPNRVLIYSLEGGLPMFFDVDSRGTTIFPTVYALWKVPHLLPAFILKGGEVSRYVIGGADLMFPGIHINAEGLPEFSAGEPWAVIVPGNPAPIAVGSTYMSSSEALKAGLRGKALKISHHYRDALWESADARYVPNAGFLEDVVFEDPSQVSLSVEDVDALLDKCLLQAFYTTLKDKDLPIAGSTLWSNHVLPCRPPGTVLDIKKSSHKKLSKWLQSKTSQGLISSKEDKHKKEVMVLTINRKHPDYTSFKPEKQQVEQKEQTVDPVNETNTNNRMEVIEIYKPSVHVNPIFTSVGADTRQLYTQSEATEVVFAYIEKENLVKPTNKSIVVLDAILCDALFKGAIKKGSTYPSEIHKKDLAPTFVNRMQAHHQVTRGKETVVRKGGLKPMQIMTERRQGNKKVTKLTGMESFLIDAEPLASELQKKFACSTSVSELPGKKGHEVLVQGGVIDVLARYLVEQYGIPKKYIEILDKTARK